MKYNIIYCDVPWTYTDKARAGNRGVEFKYPTMKLDDVCELPVDEIADDNCCLFFWVTSPQLPNMFRVLDSWGFTYKNKAFNWIKTNKKKTDTLFWGMGNWTRANSEDCYLAVKGKPKRKSAKVHQVIMSSVTKHSSKPPEVRDRIVQLCGDVPRIELFAREKTDGWDVLGNDIDGKDIRDSIKDLISPKEFHDFKKVWQSNKKEVDNCPNFFKDVFSEAKKKGKKC